MGTSLSVSFLAQVRPAGERGLALLGGDEVGVGGGPHGEAESNQSV